MNSNHNSTLHILIINILFDIFILCTFLCVTYVTQTLFLNYLINLFLAALGPCCCARALPSCGEWGPLLTAVHGLPTAVASLAREHGLQARGPQQLWHTGPAAAARRLQSAGSVVVVHRPSCSAACGIFPDQGSNPCPLHWQADSQPLRHQGSPHTFSV